jgi:PAS domain-containing protein
MARGCSSGYDNAEIDGAPFLGLLSEEALERTWPDHELEGRHGGAFRGRRLAPAQGRHALLGQHRHHPADGRDGATRAASPRSRDLSERRKQEEMLRASEERFRLLVEGVKDYAIFMLDPSGHVVSWNLGAQKNKGYKASRSSAALLEVLSARRRLRAAGPAGVAQRAARRPLRGRGLARAQGRHAVLGQRGDHRPVRRHRPAQGLCQGHPRPDRAPQRHARWRTRAAHDHLPGHARPRAAQPAGADLERARTAQAREGGSKVLVSARATSSGASCSR